MKKYLYGHISEETAYEVDDYPWGFRLRTKVRYWIESSNTHGQRVVKQTLNPKTGIWCKPKKSTYSFVSILYLNEKGHIENHSITMRKLNSDFIKNFIETHKENLSDFQKIQLKKITIAMDIRDKNRENLAKLMNVKY